MLNLFRRLKDKLCAHVAEMSNPEVALVHFSEMEIRFHSGTIRVVFPCAKSTESNGIVFSPSDSLVDELKDVLRRHVQISHVNNDRFIVHQCQRYRRVGLLLLD